MNKRQGNINIILLLVVAVIIAGGGYYLLNNKDKANVSDPSIPVKCQSVEDDVCSLFSCMTSNCWCKEGLTGGVVYQKDVLIKDKDSAEKIVVDYLVSIGSEYNQEIKVIKEDKVFFDVVAKDNKGNEKFFVVSANGQILITVCGM